MEISLEEIKLLEKGWEMKSSVFTFSDEVETFFVKECVKEGYNVVGLVFEKEVYRSLFSFLFDKGLSEKLPKVLESFGKDINVELKFEGGQGFLIVFKKTEKLLIVDKVIPTFSQKMVLL